MGCNPFLDSLNHFQADFGRLEHKESELMVHKTRLVEDLKKISQKDSGYLNKESSLYQQSEKVKKVIDQSIHDWAKTWEDASPMRALSDSFTNKLIFLVFGKVNAGKSSFCNFLADQFPADQIKPFYLKEGKIK